MAGRDAGGLPAASGGGYVSRYNVQLQQLDSIPLAVIRRQARPAELSRVVPECCGLVWNAVRAPADSGRSPRRDLLGWDHSARGRGRAARAVCRAGRGGSLGDARWRRGLGHALGPYSGLGAAHGAVRDWCRAGNHRLAGPSWEIYGHWQREWNDDPSQIRTDIFYLLAPA